MWEAIILWAIIALAAAACLRWLYKIFTGKQTGCSCSSDSCANCPGSSPAQPPTSRPDKPPGPNEPGASHKKA